jgi:PGF-pre-PGF domain-containing protein
MPENLWATPPSGFENYETPPENLLSTSVPPWIDTEEENYDWIPPENKPFWTWQEDNITTDAPVGFSISEDSTLFIRPADDEPWTTTEITAENVSVGGLKIDVSENVSDVVVTVLPLEPEDLPENVPQPEENYCEFFQVGTDIPDSIENAEIGIKVDQDWIAANNLDDSSITLQHCVDGVWTELPTTITGEDANYLYVSAETPSFSVFAVTGETAAVGVSSGIPITTIAAIAIGVLVAASAIVLLMRRKK